MTTETTPPAETMAGHTVLVLPLSITRRNGFAKISDANGVEIMQPLCPMMADNERHACAIIHAVNSHAALKAEVAELRDIVSRFLFLEADYELEASEAEKLREIAVEKARTALKEGSV